MIDYMQKFRLDNKKAFVMGGLGLIGKQVSIAYSMAGSQLTVLDLDETEGESFKNEMKESGFDISFVHFDCSDNKQITEYFLTIIEKYGCPDIFINCSYPRTKEWGNSSFKNITIESLNDNLSLQLNSQIWLSRLVAEEMVNQKIPGSIIHLGSTYGVVGQDLSIYEGTDMHENISYSVIKGGINNLTRSMCSYYGQYNIRINTLCPGGLEGHVAGKSSNQNPMFVKQYSKKTPLKRLGKAEEVATTALFLASDASSYINGATIMVDGGWTAI